MKTVKSTLLLVLVCLITSVCAGASQSHIILPVTQGGQNFFGEFALDGSLVRNLGSYPGGTRDYVPDEQGNLHTYTGTFNPSIMSQNNGSWTSQTYAGWSTVNNLSYGGIAVLGNSVYVTDMWTAYDGNPQGIVRFSKNGGAPVRFATSIEPIDVATEGSYVYALSGNYWNSLSVYNPADLSFTRNIPLVGTDVRSIAVKKNGELFTADWSGNICHLSSTGQLLDTLTIPGMTFSDINLDEETGSIVLGTGFGRGIFLTDENLDSYRQFTASDPSLGFPTEFASFQVVPEPSILAFTGLGLMCAMVRKRK